MDVHPTKNVSIGIDPYPYYEVITHPVQHKTPRVPQSPSEKKYHFGDRKNTNIKS
jgi:hypothetical protein